MNNLVIERPNTFGSINPQKSFRLITGLVEFSSFGYSNPLAQKLLAISERTNNEIVLQEENPHVPSLPIRTAFHRT